MATYNIQSLLADLQGVLHGTQLNQIQGVDNLIYRAARRLLLDIDPQETKRTVEFINPIFNTVYDYPIATDVKGNKLIDIRPQINRIPRDIWSQSYNQAFDIAKQNLYMSKNMFTLNFNTGIKTIRINAPYINPPVIINQVEAITTNGTWSVGGTASNLAVNNSNYVQGGGSLQFNLGVGTGYLVNSTMTAVNLSAVVNQASIFLNTYFQTGSGITSVELQFGSDASDYYDLTVTQTQQNTAFQNGWNLLQYAWENSTVVGTPNAAAINYVKVIYTVTTIQTGCLLNGINSILGSVMEYEYYSKYLFRDAITGVFQETVTDNSNLINLDTESYNLLFNLSAAYAFQQQQGLDAMFYDGNFFMREYQEGVARYNALYKSEVQKPQSTYYGMPRVKNNRFIGGKFTSPSS